MKIFSSIVILLFTSWAYGQNIFEVARNGGMARLNELISLNPDTVNSQNASGHSPLILAAYHGQDRVVEGLISGGADVNYTFSQGAAIHGAAFKGYLSIVELLVLHGAKLDEPDQNKTTPLIYATLFGHTEVAEYLYSKGADASYKDATGHSALTYAESLNNQELLNLFNQ